MSPFFCTYFFDPKNSSKPMKHIRTFSDDSEIFFDKGIFDEWCIYFKKPGSKKFAPTDIQYFTRLVVLGGVFGNKHIYNHFVEIYNRTTSEINQETLTTIQELSTTYGKTSLEIEKIFTIIYAGMVAEENKVKAILKKRIKRLGIHQILIDNLDPQLAAVFSRGKNWKELDAICKEKGF
jgi:hypothetical protein